MKQAASTADLFHARFLLGASSTLKIEVTFSLKQNEAGNIF
jgi:hypothetical protein